MAKVERFEDLRCWQRARALTNAVYQLVSEERLSKDYRLRDQLTGAAISVMTNIAEGFSRYHRGDFIRFLDFAQSSAAEVKSLLYIVLDQQYAAPAQVEKMQQLSVTCQKMILALIKHLRKQKSQTDRAHEPPSSYEHAADHEPHYELPHHFAQKNDNA